MTYQPNCTLNEFESRLRKAIPTLHIKHSTDKLDEIEHILRTVLQEPLNYPKGASLPPDTFWWLRGTDSMPLTGYEYTGDNILILKSGASGEELAVEQLIVYRMPVLSDLSLLYLRCKGVPSVFSQQGRRERGDYLVDEDRYVSLANGDSVPSGSGIEVRTRHLQKYNGFIATKESRFNVQPSGYRILLEEACDALLWTSKTLEDVITVFAALPHSPFYQHLLDSQ